jgi:hypothetical protein
VYEISNKVLIDSSLIFIKQLFIDWLKNMKLDVLQFGSSYNEIKFVTFSTFKFLNQHWKHILWFHNFNERIRWVIKSLKMTFCTVWIINDKKFLPINTNFVSITLVTVRHKLNVKVIKVFLNHKTFQKR